MAETGPAPPRPSPSRPSLSRSSLSPSSRSSSSGSMRWRRGLALAAGLAWWAAATTSPAAASAAPATPEAGATDASWVWPIDPPVVVSPYRAPAHAYAPGHRGIDLRAVPGDPVSAPDAGIVAFAGTVVDRGIITIDHGGGLVSTLEPVAPGVAAGAAVARGETVGTVSTGGHTGDDALHLGARVDGAYVNPLLFLGGVPWAVLLPCC